MKKFIWITAFFMLGCSEDNKKYPFEDMSLSIEERVEDLVSRLTLEEKVSQMTDHNKAIERLGIPAYNWQNECLHGVAKIADHYVTVFPQPIGLAATWNKDAMFEVGDCISDEGRAIYNEAYRNGDVKMFYGLTYWAPNINIFRDPRWGRGHETFGEDPFLTGQLGKSIVKGLQGNDSIYLKTSACAKHFAVHSGPESLRHEFNTEVNNYDLWDTYLSAFRDLIVDGDVSGVMCAYNAYGGRPCCGNDLLMMDILRNKWNFKGYVTSDCGAIDDFYKYHHTHADTVEAAADAVLHGTDLDCVRDVAFKTLVQGVREGKLSESDIDKAVKRLFTVRFRLGMFDDIEKFKYSNIPLSVLDSKEHKELALKMAQESIVLLKNEQNTLPLNKNIRKLAVIGPNADNDLVLLGNYHGYPSKTTTILQGIKEAVSEDTEVIYEKMTDYLELDNFVPLNINNCLFKGKKGFYVELYDNDKFKGEPVISQKESIDLHYRGKKNIAEGISSLSFSAKYFTSFSPSQSGEYTIKIDTDKDYELYVNNELCMNNNLSDSKLKGKYTSFFEKGKSYIINLNVKFNGRHGDLKLDIGNTVDINLTQLSERVKDSDAIIFVGGISPSLEGEENGVQCEGFEGGDRTTIMLPKVQTELMKELKKTGKPVIFVMLTGSAMAINWENDNIPAILNVWYGGQAAGKAIADVLFGDYNPSGKLPITFYKSDNDLPPFTDYNMEGRTYRYFKGKVLYPFGYGLSYTKFKYDNIRVKSNVSTSDSLRIEVDVYNIGKIKGDDVAQLYITHLDKEPYLPIRALKGFERVSLLPGEKKTISFVLSPRELATFNDFSECSVRPGDLCISVGGGQPYTGTSTVEKKVELIGKVNILPM